MKILNKILFSGAIFTAAFLSGCSDDDYTPGEASNARYKRILRITNQR